MSRFLSFFFFDGRATLHLISSSASTKPAGSYPAPAPAPVQATRRRAAAPVSAVAPNLGWVTGAKAALPRGPSRTCSQPCRTQGATPTPLGSLRHSRGAAAARLDSQRLRVHDDWARAAMAGRVRVGTSHQACGECGCGKRAVAPRTFAVRSLAPPSKNARDVQRILPLQPRSSRVSLRPRTRAPHPADQCAHAPCRPARMLQMRAPRAAHVRVHSGGAARQQRVTVATQDCTSLLPRPPSQCIYLVRNLTAITPPCFTPVTYSTHPHGCWWHVLKPCALRAAHCALRTARCASLLQHMPAWPAPCSEYARRPRS